MKVKELGEQHATMLTTKPNIVCTLCMSVKDSEAPEIFKSVHDMELNPKSTGLFPPGAALGGGVFSNPQ